MKDFDQREIRQFYDPHPLVYGSKSCSPPIEASLAAKELDGQSMSVYEAEGKLAAAIKKAGVLKIKPEKNCISLEVAYENRPYDEGHTFTLIKFR